MTTSIRGAFVGPTASSRFEREPRSEGGLSRKVRGLDFCRRTELLNETEDEVHPLQRRCGRLVASEE